MSASTRKSGTVAVERRQLLLGGLAFGTSIGASTAFAAEASADLIITNANIWTGDRTRPTAEAIAIQEGRILAVGTAGAVARYAGARTRTVDARGRFIMPGFNDSHIHLTGSAAAFRFVSLLGAVSFDEVRARIRERVKTTPPGAWVMANAQWHEALLRENRMPTRADLDPVSPDNPVVIPRGGHVATCNSRALAIAGITRDTPDPPGGVIARDANGEPTGLLLEQARYLLIKHLPVLGVDDYRANLRAQIADYSRLGITSLTNPGTADNALSALQALRDADELAVRVHWTANISSAAAVRALRARHAPFAGDDFLRFSGIGEPGTDGGIEAAYLREPYNLVPGDQTDPNYRGVAMPWVKDTAGYDAFYEAAVEAGFNVMTHVTGDAGLDIALDALERVAPKADFRPLRWTLHGCFLTDDAQLARIRKLGVYITAQAQPYLLGRQMVKWWGRARTDRAIPVGAFVKAGVPVALGSDAPAGIASPLESLGWFVNRLCLGDLQLDRQWSIPVEVGLRLYTQASAETQFMEKKVGVLAPGMLADLVMLEESPLKAPSAELPKIPVDATLVGGKVVFDRDGRFS